MIQLTDANTNSFIHVNPEHISSIERTSVNNANTIVYLDFMVEGGQVMYHSVTESMDEVLRRIRTEQNGDPALLRAQIRRMDAEARDVDDAIDHRRRNADYQRFIMANVSIQSIVGIGIFIVLCIIAAHLLG